MQLQGVAHAASRIYLQSPPMRILLKIFNFQPMIFQATFAADLNDGLKTGNRPVGFGRIVEYGKE
jgi:hypothetical protein